MTEIVVPQLDANSESATLISWEVEEGAAVARNAAVCTVETSKSVYEVVSPADGVLVRAAGVGDTVPLNTPIGFVARDAAEAQQIKDSRHKLTEAGAAAEINATRKAKELARQHNLDLTKVRSEGIITEEDVAAHLWATPKGATAHLKTGQLPDAVRRVLVIAAGYGSMQTIDILMNQPDVRVVGCVDDNASLRGVELFGAPVLAAIADIPRLWSERVFDHAIVGITTNIALRKRFFEQCKALGIPMVNAIDPTVRINRGAVLGTGNILCSHCHIGVATRIGDNNFISANTSIDHHNVWGSHITTGPNCATSGVVAVGDETKFGTGIFVEPNLNIGARCLVASGSIITRSIPDRHVVKTRVTSEVRPL